MTPEERRRRVEEAVRAAEQGILLEPAYEREEYERQKATGTLPPPVDDLPDDESDTPASAEKPAA